MQELIYLTTQAMGFNTQAIISQEWGRYCEIAPGSLEKVKAHAE